METSNAIHWLLRAVCRQSVFTGAAHKIQYGRYDFLAGGCCPLLPQMHGFTLHAFQVLSLSDSNIVPDVFSTSLCSIEASAAAISLPISSADGSALALVELGVYLHCQNMKTPPVLDSGACIPFTLTIVFELGKKSYVMRPRQLSRQCLDNLFTRPSFSEATHIH